MLSRQYRGRFRPAAGGRRPGSIPGIRSPADPGGCRSGG